MKELWPHQITGVQDLLTHKRRILGDKMGAGKTRQVVEAFKRSGVVEGLGVALRTSLDDWGAEFQEYCPEVAVFFYRGTPDQRSKALKAFQAARGPKVLLTHYWLLQQLLEAMPKKTWPAVWADEAHRLLRNRKNETWRLMKQLTQHSHYVWLLTGSPVVRHGSDFLSYAMLLWPHAYPSYWRLVDQFFYVTVNWYGGRELGPAKDPQAFRDWCFMHMTRRTEFPGMPSVVRTAMRVELSPEVRELYNRLAREWLVQVGESEGIAAKTKLDQMLKLRQVLVTPKILSESFPAGTLEVLLEEIQDAIDLKEQVVVFTPFRAALEVLETHLADKTSFTTITGGLKDGEAEARAAKFRNWQIQVVGATIQMALGYSLWNADRVYFWGFDWDSASMEQAERRIARPPRNQPLTPRYIVHPNTLDQHVLDVIRGKASWDRLLQTPKDLVGL